jgi:hypothetical protein
MKKIIKWIFKSKVNLAEKWWHRFFKVLFVLIIVASTIYLVTFLSNSYSQIVHQWNYIDTLSGRLSKNAYTGKVFSISDLYESNEAISDDYASGGWSLEDKRYVEPLSPLFLPEGQIQTFCSDSLSKHIENIAYINNIKLFSDTNPTAYKLYDDIDAFSTYLKNNSYSVKCLFVDSFTMSNEDGTTSKLTFLRPENTSEYSIYRYENNFSGFILSVLLSAVFLLFCILGTMLIYYKVIMYIIYGRIEINSSE